MSQNSTVTKILYIEDDIANLQLVEFIFQTRDDIELDTAKTGREGIEAAKSILPNIILLDISLPDLSGYQVLENIRAESTTAHIPVVAVSGDSAVEDIQKGLNAGFNGYLTKPIILDELFEQIAKNLK